MVKSESNPRLSWYEHEGLRILLPSNLSVEQPFPLLYARSIEGMESIAVTITSDPVQRQLAELIFSQLPRSTPPDIEVDIIQNRHLDSPYLGRELIWQIKVKENPVPSYAIRRVLDLDESSGTIANIELQGKGKYQDVKILCDTIMNSFIWTSPEETYLKHSGEENTYPFPGVGEDSNACSASGPVLPARLAYLQPAMDNLCSLRPEEIDDDLDMPLLGELLRKRTEGLQPKDAESRLKADHAELSVWIKQNPHCTCQGEFVLNFIDLLLSVASLKASIYEDKLP